MKYIAHLIILFTVAAGLTCIPVSGQKKGQTGADYYKNREYALAVKAFEKELKKAKKKKADQARIESYMGMSYHYMNKPREASEHLKKGLDLGYKKADAFAVYGLSLQKQEKYTEALDAFNQCLKTDAKYPNIDLYIQSCNYALEHPEPNNQIVLRSSKVNTGGSEYGISTGPEGEIFFSRAPVKGRIDPRTGLAYTEVYVGKLDANDLTKPEKEKAFMKAYYNTGVFSYDAQTKYIYMTVCDPKGKCGIYRSLYNRKKWDKPEPVFINDKYDMVHPTITGDGKRMYFSSNAPSGFGKTDIWYADRTDGDKWSNPVNAGNKLNTPGREEFPYAGEDGFLYFASDGYSGFGGLDIFKVTVEGNSFGTPQNLGRPFNGGADDFNLITAGDKGLLISSRNIDSGDDVYIFAKADLSRTETAKEEEQKPEPETKPEPVIAQEEPEPMVTKGEPEPIVAEKPEPTVKEPEPTVKKPARPTGNNIAVIYFDFNRFVPQREYRDQYSEIAAQMKAYPNATFEIAGYTDPRGGREFNTELSDKRAEYIAKRLIDRGIPKSNLVVKGYGFQDPAAPNATNEEEFQLNRRVEIRIIKTSN